MSHLHKQYIGELNEFKQDESPLYHISSAAEDTPTQMYKFKSNKQSSSIILTDWCDNMYLVINFI